MINTLTLNGIQMPALGFGVFQTPPDETAEAVEAALRVGYRHIDTAAAYANERGVGDVIRRSGLDVDDVFIETKVWISDYGYDETLHAFDKSATKLGVEHIDLLILHQALPGEFTRTIDAYRALEALLADGKVRAIGVSNFMPDHLDRLIAATSVVPAVNQVSTLQDETIVAIGRAYGKSPAQVMLPWHLQHGRAAIPKSTNPTRIAENVDVFDFELADADMERMDGLDTGIRGGPEPDTITLEAYGRAIPEA